MTPEAGDGGDPPELEPEAVADASAARTLTAEPAATN